MQVRGCASLAPPTSAVALAAHGTRLVVCDAATVTVLNPLLPSRTPATITLPADALNPTFLAATRSHVILANSAQNVLTVIRAVDGARRCVPIGVRTLVASGDWFAALSLDGTRLALYADADALPAALPPSLSLPSQRSIALVAAGAQHVLLTDQRGNVYSVGSNAYGQLGLGEEGEGEHEARVPRPVTLPAPALSIAAGAWHSAACLSSGEVYVWGSNAAGQLGLGEGRPGRPAPKCLKALPRCTAVACGTRHSAALSVDGAVHVWGFWGAETHHTPTRISGGPDSPDVLRPSSLGAGGWFTWYAPA